MKTRYKISIIALSVIAVVGGILSIPALTYDTNLKESMKTPKHSSGKMFGELNCLQRYQFAESAASLDREERKQLRDRLEECKDMGFEYHAGEFVDHYEKYLDENNELNFGLMYGNNGIVIDPLQRILDICYYSGEIPEHWYFDWNNATHHIDSDECIWISSEEWTEKHECKPEPRPENEGGLWIFDYEKCEWNNKQWWMNDHLEEIIQDCLKPELKTGVKTISNGTTKLKTTTCTWQHGGFYNQVYVEEWADPVPLIQDNKIIGPDGQIFKMLED